MPEVNFLVKKGLTVPKASASTPAIIFDASDSNTGLYSPGADQVAISTNGTGRLFVSSTGTVAIGSDSAVGNRLDLVSNVSGLLGLHRTGTAGDTRLIFYNDNAFSTRTIASRIASLLTTTTAGAEAGAIYFETISAGAVSEKMRLDSSGRLGLGTSSPDRLLHVSAADTAYIRLENQDSTGSVDQYVGLIEFEGQDTGGSGVRAQIGGIYEGVSGATALVFGTSADGGSVTERLRINRNGNVGIGTTSPSASALLDVSSTTQGLLPPRMTGVQRDAISSPAAGLMIYNTTTNKLNFYNGTAWEAVTSA